MQLNRLKPKFKWSKTDKKYLRLLVENGWIVKVHAYRKKNPSFMVRPANIKDNNRRIPIGHFEKLREHGAFEPPYMNGDWYLFLLKEDVEKDVSIFLDMLASECFVIGLCLEGKRIRRGFGNRQNNMSFFACNGDQPIGLLEYKALLTLIDKGWLVEGEKDGDYTWYDFVDLRA